MAQQIIDIWPKRISLSAYRKAAFVAGAPCVTTIKKYIALGEIPGEVEGTTYYVWVNQHLRPEWPADRYKPKDTGNELADAMLANFLAKQRA